MPPRRRRCRSPLLLQRCSLSWRGIQHISPAGRDGESTRARVRPSPSSLGLAWPCEGLGTRGREGGRDGRSARALPPLDGDRATPGRRPADVPSRSFVWCRCRLRRRRRVRDARAPQLNPRHIFSCSKTYMVARRARAVGPCDTSGKKLPLRIRSQISDYSCIFYTRTSMCTAYCVAAADVFLLPTLPPSLGRPD